MKVLASPFVPNSPDTPKSQSLTWPERLRRMLDGLMSKLALASSIPSRDELTSVYDLPAVEIC